MNKHSTAERSDFYASIFPKWPKPRADARWLDGVWVMGNNYKGSGFYGSYPPGYLKRVMALFPDAKNVLHLFSGSLQPSELAKLSGKHTRIDINPALNPDILGSANELSKIITPGTYDLIIADPPYSKDDAKRYGTKMINRRVVLAEASKILPVGGQLVWLDTVLPMYRKSEWNLWGLIGMVRSTNHRFRLVSIFEKI